VSQQREAIEFQRLAQRLEVLDGAEKLNCDGSPVSVRPLPRAS
jgi:hypothetical protein